jgi:hypothetical protein
MDTDLVQLRTGARVVTDVTQVVLQFCRDRGDGLCHVFVPHATAGLALIETGSGSESDLEDAIGRLLPREDIYDTGMVAAVTAVIMCCRQSYHPRSRFQCSMAGPHSVPGRAWCWWIRTLTTLTGRFGLASFRVDLGPGL